MIFKDEHFKKLLVNGDRVAIGDGYRYITHTVTLQTAQKMGHKIHEELVINGFDLRRHIERTEDNVNNTITYHQFLPIEQRRV